MLRRFIAFLAVLAGILIVYFSFEWAMGAVIHSRRTIPVPDLTGRTPGEALSLLSLNHLGMMKEGEQYDKRYPAGVVLRQNPVGGMLVREGRVIQITLSQGGETLYVPDLTGQPLRNAQTTLQNAGLSIGEIERRPSLKFDKDSVISTDPPANAVISKNGLVAFIVSDGPPASDVQLAPDFMGKSAEQVQRWADNHNVTVTVRKENDALKPSGIVLSQSPAADSPIRAGDTLTIVINGAGPSEGSHVHFVVPAGNEDRDVKITVVDETGDHEVFRRAQAPGSIIDFPVTAKGRARARIFVNGIFAEEQELQ